MGPQHVTLEAAATDLAETAAGRPLQVTDWYVMLTSRGTAGPFRTEGECFPGVNGTWGARVNLIDDGNNERVVSTCAAMFR